MTNIYEFRVVSKADNNVSWQFIQSLFLVLMAGCSPEKRAEILGYVVFYLFSHCVQMK
jgi:hypothetical protein